jgi:hypothetical protein
MPRIEDRKDLARSGETAQVLAGTTGENDPVTRATRLGYAMTYSEEGRAVNCDDGIHVEHPVTSSRSLTAPGIRLAGSQGNRINP